MSFAGDDEPPSPSAYLEAPSSQSLITDTQPFASQSPPVKDIAANGDFSSDQDSQDERENRFPGPANTWRKYTADERSLIASLDQERANDLSVHLYNAHALKSRLYDPDVASDAKSWHSKRNWIKADEDGSTPWHPDQNWTAWPLRADDVPRKSEGFGKDPLVDHTDEGMLKVRRPWRPGTDLEEEIHALMLRRAKNRFRLRTWETGLSPALNNAIPKRLPSLSQMPSSPPTVVDSRQSSVASDVRSQTSNDRIDDTSTQLHAKPAFIVDDEESNRLLKQSARHITSKLDDLLTGLHKSRHHQAMGSIASDESSARSKSNKRKRRSTTVESPDLSAEADSHDFDLQAKRKKAKDRDSNNHPSGPHAANPRDWSEVLGFASLTGWDSAVIDRAAKRCAALFGERMVIRTMSESAAGKATDSIKEYKPEMISDIESSDEEEEEDEQEEEVSSAIGFNCPEQLCPQHRRFYVKRWQIRQHLRHTHKYSQEALDAYGKTQTIPDAKPSVEHIDREEEVDVDADDETGEEPTQPPAVHTDGFMEPVDLFLGRGTDAVKRKSKLPTR